MKAKLTNRKYLPIVFLYALVLSSCAEKEEALKKQEDSITNSTVVPQKVTPPSTNTISSKRPGYLDVVETLDLAGFDPVKYHYSLPTAEEQTLYKEPTLDSDIVTVLPAGSIITFVGYWADATRQWVCTVANHSVIGWIDAFELSVDNDPYYTAEVIDAANQKKVSSLQNSYKRAKANEFSIINDHEEVQRKGPILIIELFNSKKIFLETLESDDYSGCWYSFSDTLDDNVVIHQQYYEGAQYQVINNESGDIIVVNDAPKLSKENNCFLSVGSAYDEPKRIQLFELDLTNKYRWIVNEEIPIESMTFRYYVDSYEWIERERAEIIVKDSSFTPKENIVIHLYKENGIWRISRS